MFQLPQNTHFARECRAPRSQDRGKRKSYKQGLKVEEPAPKALMAIDGIGWDWSCMANEEENHALVADDEFATEFALMAKSSLGSDNEGNLQNNINDKRYWDSGCSRHMTRNIAYLSEYEPYDGGYVSSGHGVVTDDFSRFTWTFFLRTKDTTSSILRNFITEIENLKDLKVKIIRCDNGGECKNQEMNEFCTRKGIRREFSIARTPQQNGVAERSNRTLIEAARTMMADAKLPVTFWAESVNTACYVQNRVLVNKSQNKTPYELFNTNL
nr:putative ribonuclease H-like domain-containing protein [Tanacetum cinerariifolium]